VRRPSRRFPRMTVRIEVDYRTPSGKERNYATTLGAGGLFIAAPSPPSIGTRLAMRFQLSEGKPQHEIEGRVTWSCSAEMARENGSSPGFGVQFSDPLATSSLARELEALNNSPDYQPADLLDSLQAKDG
jgi:uncharacterized protein (TIGR02266 family)